MAFLTYGIEKEKEVDYRYYYGLSDEEPQEEKIVFSNPVAIMPLLTFCDAMLNGSQRKLLPSSLNIPDSHQGTHFWVTGT